MRPEQWQQVEKKPSTMPLRLDPVLRSSYRHSFAVAELRPEVDLLRLMFWRKSGFLRRTIALLPDVSPTTPATRIGRRLGASTS